MDVELDMSATNDPCKERQGMINSSSGFSRPEQLHMSYDTASSLSCEPIELGQVLATESDNKFLFRHAIFVTPSLINFPYLSQDNL